MILEIIGKIFCGINIENARDPENVFIKNMKICMGGDDISMDWTFTLGGTSIPTSFHAESSNNLKLFTDWNWTQLLFRF